MTEGDLNQDTKQQKQQEETQLPGEVAVVLGIARWVIGPALAVAAYLVVRWAVSVLLR